MKIDQVAMSELGQVRDWVAGHPEYLDHLHVADIYRQNGCVVQPGRWHSQSERIEHALVTGKPLSIIRIGDGEVHLLGAGTRTPALDRYLLGRVLHRHSDTVPPTDEWTTTLRRWMERSIASADVIGVRGIDPSGGLGGVAARLDAIERDPRGGVGVLRAIAAMLELARQGALAGKVVASAHLYFGVLQRLDRLVNAAEAVVLICSRASVAQELALRYTKPFTLIQTGKRDGGMEGEFLQRVERELPGDLAGHLCLIGAGVWSEFYCDWAKQRGGVAVDIGSGFDLLAGEQTRPIHRRVLADDDAMASIRAAIDDSTTTSKPAERSSRESNTEQVKPSGFMVSMVVDWLDSHPYQAEVLLTTLEEVACIPRHRMVVQCTDRVPNEVVDEFRQRGHVVVVIEPYLDRTYCNKIAQLDHFLTPEGFDAGTEGVLLLDLDIAALERLAIPDPDVVWGKVVDGPNPPLADIKAVFAKAGVPMPDVVPCDWRERGQTIATNLNGGVLYIPRAQVAAVREGWRHWAEWLHEDASAIAAARKHIDQISFAMTLASSAIPWRHLPTNWNFPGGHDRTPSLDASEPVRILHYHSWGLTDAGLVAPTYAQTSVLDEGVVRVNRRISNRPMAFFERFRRDRALDALSDVPLLEANLFSSEFVQREVDVGCRRRLVLHGGAPKTGTSSLQWHLAENREELAGRGIWFPPPTFSPEPKHQLLSATLRRGDIAGFVRYVEAALGDMPDDTHTVILTTEGIFNHWWDYPPEAKGALRRLAALFDFELCLWLREPVSFAAALWAQYLQNLRTEGPSANVQGQDVSLAEAMDDGWFRRHLDYFGVFQEMELLFGKGRVRTLPFRGDTVQQFLDEYDISPLPVPPRRHNASLGRLGVAFVRLVNRHFNDGPNRTRALRCIERLDRGVRPLTGRVRVTDKERALIEQSSAAPWRAMQPLLDAPGPRRRRWRPKVFCIGFHRTGTKSLAAALKQLGYRVTGPNSARDPAIANHALVLALGLAGEFDALNDNPTPLLYREIDTAFPGSRFILTTRSTDAWLASAVRYFSADETPMREWIYGHGSPLGFEAVYRQRYEAHNAEVASYFEGRSDLLLLDFERGDGWPELCAFLGGEVPESSFPHVNRTASR